MNSAVDEMLCRRTEDRHVEIEVWFLFERGGTGGRGLGEDNMVLNAAESGMVVQDVLEMAQIVEMVWRYLEEQEKKKKQFDI